MTDPTVSLDLLELAERDTPFCTSCGEATVLAADDGGTIWLQCSTLGRRKSLVRRIFAVAGAHTRREVLPAWSGEVV